MSAVETASMMSDGGLNISQLRILFKKILRNKLGAKIVDDDDDDDDDDAEGDAIFITVVFYELCFILSLLTYDMLPTT